MPVYNNQLINETLQKAVSDTASSFNADFFMIQHVAPITQKNDNANVSATTGSSNGTSILSAGNPHAESISEPTRNDKESGKRSVGKRISKKQNK